MPYEIPLPEKERSLMPRPPILDRLAIDHGDKLTVARLDVDANPLTAQQFQVASIPTMIVFKEGILTTRLVGALAKPALLNQLRDYLYTIWYSTSPLLAPAVKATPRRQCSVSPTTWMALVPDGRDGLRVLSPWPCTHPLREGR